MLRILSASCALLDQCYFDPRILHTLNNKTIPTTDVENRSRGRILFHCFENASVPMSKPERRILNLEACLISPIGVGDGGRGSGTPLPIRCLFEISADFR